MATSTPHGLAPLELDGMSPNPGRRRPKRKQRRRQTPSNEEIEHGMYLLELVIDDLGTMAGQRTTGEPIDRGFVEAIVRKLEAFIDYAGTHNLTVSDGVSGALAMLRRYLAQTDSGPSTSTRT